VAVERDELDRLRKELNEKQEVVKRKTEEVNELLRRVTIQEVELNAAKEERDNARDTLEQSGLPKDEMVKRACEVRDQAVARKNVVEIELAKTRIEVMHINSQLMEAIQRKVELSQQLEQFELDMQCLLDDNLKKKLSSHEKTRKLRGSGTEVTNSSNVSPILNSSLAASLVNKSKLLRLWR
jgi:coiled-coil domain-containing protein 64